MFRRFMYGRYGNDHFNLALIVISLIFGFASMFVPGIASTVLWGLQLSVLVYWVFRAFSRNIYARRRENAWFLRLWAIRGFFRTVKSFFQRLSDTKHKYFKCPGCKARLRVPKGRGSITVTCPRCKAKFDKKS